MKLAEKYLPEKCLDIAQMLGCNIVETDSVNGSEVSRVNMAKILGMFDKKLGQKFMQNVADMSAQERADLSSTNDAVDFITAQAQAKMSVALGSARESTANPTNPTDTDKNGEGENK